MSPPFLGCVMHWNIAAERGQGVPLLVHLQDQSVTPDTQKTHTHTHFFLSIPFCPSVRPSPGGSWLRLNKTMMNTQSVSCLQLPELNNTPLLLLPAAAGAGSRFYYTCGCSSDSRRRRRRRRSFSMLCVCVHILNCNATHTHAPHNTPRLRKIIYTDTQANFLHSLGFESCRCACGYSWFGRENLAGLSLSNY